ncbi:hypothetical protein BJX64DRAFT_51766 [Aspergillus heterothallicus]
MTRHHTPSLSSPRRLKGGLAVGWSRDTRRRTQSRRRLVGRQCSHGKAKGGLSDGPAAISAEDRQFAAKPGGIASKQVRGFPIRLPLISDGIFRSQSAMRDIVVLWPSIELRVGADVYIAGGSEGQRGGRSLEKNQKCFSKSVYLFYLSRPSYLVQLESTTHHDCTT